jgi:hypothetical protein
LEIDSSGLKPIPLIKVRNLIEKLPAVTNNNLQ